MNTQIDSGALLGGRELLPRKVADLPNIGVRAPAEPVSPGALRSNEPAKTLDRTAGANASLLAPLNSFLGEGLTSNNSAWTGDPIPKMRALQKTLVEHGIGLPEGERDAAMQAITVIERSIQLRLRLQQHRMLEFEIPQATQGEKKI